VTEELSQRLIQKFSGQPFFIQEKEQTRKVIDQYPRALRSPGEMLFTPDVYSAQLNEGSKGKKWLKAMGRIFGFERIHKRGARCSLPGDGVPPRTENF
jgi:hypothetical protein